MDFASSCQHFTTSVNTHFSGKIQVGTPQPINEAHPTVSTHRVKMSMNNSIIRTFIVPLWDELNFGSMQDHSNENSCAIPQGMGFKELMSTESNYLAFHLSMLERHLAYLLLLRLKQIDIPSTNSRIRETREEISALQQQLFGESKSKIQNAVTELQNFLAIIDGFDDPSSKYQKALVYKYGAIKIRMRSEKNHNRPHFHIEYKQEYSASYAVDTFELLAGTMPRKYEKPMLEWAIDHQNALFETWNKLNSEEQIGELTVKGPKE